MAVSAAPPKKKQEPVTLPKKVSEKKILDIINKGGKPTAEINSFEIDDSVKGITVKLMSSEMETIKELRDKRPALRGKKITISLHDWIVEAVQEKIEREKKQYRI
jgi:hypothetical protein